MKTFSTLFVTSGAWLVFAGCTLPLSSVLSRPFPPPEPQPRELPGEVKGRRLKTRWLAPYVSVTTRSIGEAGTTTVQWFTPDGKVARELTGPNVDAHPGYVSEYREGKGTIHAVNDDWKITLPQKAGPAGYITCTGDSRTFVHEYHPKEGEIAADVYVDGRLAGTIGPFLQYQGQDVQLGGDGSVAFLVWKDEKKKVVQVVVAGPSAKVRFRVDCEGPVTSTVPAPDGVGVLVQDNNADAARNTFTFYTKAGKVSSPIRHRTDFLTWLPGTTTALMYTQRGYDYRFHLIDWNTGKRVWDIPDPNPSRVPGSYFSVAVFGDHLLLGGQEYIKWGEHQKAVRSIYALEPKTGKVVAHWLSDSMDQPTGDGGRFLQLGRKLFLVTDEEFAEVSLGDIAAKKNGWK